LRSRRRIARESIARICRPVERRFPELVALLPEAGVDILAFHGSPAAHRRQIWSTNSLERLNREVTRRCQVVGILPDWQALLGCAQARGNSSCPPSTRPLSSDADPAARLARTGLAGPIGRYAAVNCCRPYPAFSALVVPPTRSNVQEHRSGLVYHQLHPGFIDDPTWWGLGAREARIDKVIGNRMGKRAIAWTIQGVRRMRWSQNVRPASWMSNTPENARRNAES
jgi:hypothetical protein